MYCFNTHGGSPLTAHLILASGLWLLGGLTPAMADCQPHSGTQVEHIVVTYNGGWTFADGRKENELVVCEGNKAQLIFRMDPRHARSARIQTVSIVPTDGSKAPMDEFVVPANEAQGSAPLDFRDKPSQSVAAQKVTVLNNNRKAGVYDYTVQVRTSRGDIRSVDPKIRNGGGAN
ncbi:MAG: hypothetical protein PVG91_04950 [Gammaproteobacteria bacterium]|jgi:hypothetical protein